MKRITDIEGVFASGSYCGIKAKGAKGADPLDLAFVFVPGAAAAVGVCTQNAFAAAPVRWTRRQLTAGHPLKGVVINSGNANAATGAQGEADASATAAKAAELLGIEPHEVAVCSTGIIGVPLPVEKIESGLSALLSEPHARDGEKAARAILTLDRVTKEVFLEETIDGHTVTVSGFAKGVGMIAPNMATMLAFLATDAALPREALDAAFRAAVAQSFNMVSVDTDTSTNDTALLFSTGAVPVQPRFVPTFTALLTRACIALARMMAKDGEGAEKLIEVTVKGAETLEQARRAALNIASSPLVKTAVHGADPNWGRILMALGKDPAVTVDSERVDLWLGSEQILAGSKLVMRERAAVKEALSGPEVAITVQLNLGPAEATAWGCDLTKAYVEINTDYN